MAFRSLQLTMSSTAQQLLVAQSGDVEVVLSLKGTGTASAMVGGSSAVSDSTGFRVAHAQGPVRLGLRAGDELWALDSAGNTITAIVRSI